MRASDLFKNKAEENLLYKVQEKYKDFLNNNEKKPSRVSVFFKDKGATLFKNVR